MATTNYSATAKQLSDVPAELAAIAAAQGDEFFRNVLEGLHEGVYFVDTQRRITYWNRGAEQITGYNRNEIVGRHCYDNLLAHVDAAGCQICKAKCPLSDAMRDRQVHEVDLYLRQRSGQRLPVKIQASAILDGSGTVMGAVETFSDNSAILDAALNAARLRRMAYLDPTTETGNRRYCEMRLAEELGRAYDSPWTFAVLFIDIDRFKTINDEFGHPAGDLVLRTVAGTLASNIGPFDALGRWGGEEFLVILTDAQPEGALVTAERLRMLVENTRAEVEGHNLHVTVSIGATGFRNADTAKSLLSRADALLYRSKREGRNKVSYSFDSRDDFAAASGLVRLQNAVGLGI